MEPPLPKKPTHGDGYFYGDRSKQWAQMKGFDKCMDCGIIFAYKEIYKRHNATFHNPQKSEKIQNEKSKTTEPPASNLVVTLTIDELIKEIVDKVAESGM